MINSQRKPNSTNIVAVRGDIIEQSSKRLFDPNNGISIIIPHVCNNINLFGAGFAAYLANKFPIVKENFHLLGNKAKLGHVQYIKIISNHENKKDLIVANMIAQNKTISPINPRPLNYEALINCMSNIRNFIYEKQKISETQVELHCPKFGSGLAGGNWKFISQLIEDCWRNIPVFVYEKN